MYYVIFKDDAGQLQVVDKEFTSLESAIAYRDTISSENDPVAAVRVVVHDRV